MSAGVGEASAQKCASNNLARIRDNQRRSRARRKEYLQELEDKYRTCEQIGVEASAEIQLAARRVLEENKRLRALLKAKGIADAEIEAAVSEAYAPPTLEKAHSAPCEPTVQPDPANQLGDMLGRRKPCGPDAQVGKPALASAGPSPTPLTVSTRISSRPRELEGPPSQSPTGSAVSPQQPKQPTSVLPSSLSSQGTQVHRHHESTPGQRQRSQVVQPPLYPHQLITPDGTSSSRSTLSLTATTPRSGTHQFSPNYQQHQEPQELQQHQQPLSAPHPTGYTMPAFQQMHTFYPYGNLSPSNVTRTTPQAWPPAGLHENGSQIQFYHGGIQGMVPTSSSTSCVVAAQFIREANPDVGPELESQMGCSEGADCKVDNNLIFDMMDQYQQSNGGAQ